jgi:hypothetical protein
MKILDKITMRLRSEDFSTMDVYIDVYDTSLGRKWLTALNDILDQELILEKNYCFMGFIFGQRGGEVILNEINNAITFLNEHSNIDYNIETDEYNLENCIQYGEVGIDLPGLMINHERFNWLHRWFEDLQGHDTGNLKTSMTPYYWQSNKETKYYIRQLNLLCHEFETWALSNRKLVQAPEWMQKSQLMCWLNAPRFNLDSDEDFTEFGVHALTKNFGGVYVGVNKAVGKTHWEVFNDEGGEPGSLGEVTTALYTQTKAAGDFDINWSPNEHFEEHKWRQRKIIEFCDWLRSNNLDPDDPSLTLGHPKVGQVDLQHSFNTDNTPIVWYILNNFLDVQSMKTSDAYAEWNYRWYDDEFVNMSIEAMPGVY